MLNFSNQCTQIRDAFHFSPRAQTSYTAAEPIARTGATGGFHVPGAFAAKVAEVRLLNIEPSPAVHEGEKKSRIVEDILWNISPFL